jgi:hypothetical protein
MKAKAGTTANAKEAKRKSVNGSTNMIRWTRDHNRISYLTGLIDNIADTLTCSDSMICNLN